MTSMEEDLGVISDLESVTGMEEVANAGDTVPPKREKVEVTKDDVARVLSFRPSAPPSITPAPPPSVPAVPAAAPVSVASAASTPDSTAVPAPPVAMPELRIDAPPAAKLEYLPFDFNPGFQSTADLITSAWVQEIRVRIVPNSYSDTLKNQIEALFNNLFEAQYDAAASTFKLVTKKKKDSEEDALLLIRSGRLLGFTPGTASTPVYTPPPPPLIQYTPQQKLVRRKEFERLISYEHVQRAFQTIKKERQIIVNILTYFANAAKKPRDALLNVSANEFGESFKSYLISYDVELNTDLSLENNIKTAEDLDEADRLVLLAAFAQGPVKVLQSITEFFQMYSPEIYSAFATFWPKFQDVCDKRRLNSSFWDAELKETRIVVFICNCAAEVTFVNAGASRAQTKIQESSSAALSRSNWYQLIKIAYELRWRQNPPSRVM